MLFNSLNFLLFFPIVCIIYFVIPKKLKWVWLLAASFYFYMSSNPQLVIFLVLSIAITYLSGILIARSNKVEDVKKRNFQKKLWVALSVLLNLGILFSFKYLEFAVQNINGLLSSMHMQLLTPVGDIIMPLGISFYTFQALTYTIDLYRGEVGVEKNIFKYALFVSFFPQVVAGPIGRSKSLLKQISEPHPFDHERVKSGLLLMLWGFFQKLVIADRISILVNNIYDNYGNFAGSSLLLATVLFGVQIYCDFSGYSDIARGAAQVMGIDLIMNFKRPYLATTVQDFWRRWHISLSTWFRDYLYIPLGGSRCSKLKKYRNTIITFLASGIWHGANWTFLLWGGLHGAYMVIGDLLKPFKKNAASRMKINVNACGPKLVKMITTFILVDFAWLFFRAPDIGTAFAIINKVLFAFYPSIIAENNLFAFGLNAQNFILMCISIVLLIFIGVLREKHNLRKELASKGVVTRWLIYYLAIFIVIIFGIYGPGYDASQFIYARF